MTFLKIFIFATFTFSAFASSNVTIETSDARKLEAILELPETYEAKSPAVLIAPGQGYHMQLPLVQRLAQKALSRGYAVLRFNWHYYTQGTKPSQNLEREYLDIASALDFLKRDSRINTEQIMVAGKSLGTILSWRLFNANKDLKGLFLLTPLCAQPQLYYPEMLKETRHIQLVLGDKDPHCALPALYDFLKDSRGNIGVTVLQGDHSLNVGPRNDPRYEQRNVENIKKAASQVVHWMNLLLMRVPNHH